MTRSWRGGLRSVRPLTIGVAVCGLGLTGVLVAATALVHERNEQRLLDQRTREAGAVLGAAVPTVESALSNAVQVADASEGDVDLFAVLTRSLVGPDKPFATVAAFRRDALDAPIAQSGESPELAAVEREPFLRRSLSHPGCRSPAS